MLSDRERAALQNLYPDAHETAGLAARKQTAFKVPVVKLILLLGLPLYGFVALVSVIEHGAVNFRTGTGNGAMLFVYLIFLILCGVLSIVLLHYAREIVGRNCARPRLVGRIYAFLIVPVSIAIAVEFPLIFGSVTVGMMLAYEAIITFAAVLVLAVLARVVSR